MKINGYFMYRYRGILLVRKGFSDVIIIHDFDAIKKYLIHVMQSVLRSEYVTWTKTNGLVEIILDVNKGYKSGFIIIEVSNELSPDSYNFSLRSIVRQEEEKKEEVKKTVPDVSYATETEKMLAEIDEIVIEEDLRRIMPIDIYEFFTAKQVDDIIKMIVNYGGHAFITEEKHVSRDR